MRQSAKLAIELSEIREKLNGEELNTPELSDEKKAERDALEKRSLEAEKEYRDALKSDEEAKDDTAFRKLEERIEARAYVGACLNETELRGAEAEFNKEEGLKDGQMPWEALLPLPEDEEHRADAATTVAAAAISKPNQPTIQRVFARTDAAFFGVRFPSVASGTPNYPIMTAGASGAMADPGAAVDAEAATFSGTVITPSRGSAAYLIRVEDAAQFSGLESLLRSDLRSVLGNVMDNVVVSGNAADPDIDGLIEHATAEVGAAPAAQLAVPDLDTVISGGIDGIHVIEPSGVSLFVGLATGRLLRSLRVTAADQNPAETLGDITRRSGVGPIRLSNRVAVPAAGIQTNYRFSRAAMIAVAPVWSGISLIRDPYTNAGSGEVRITATMLFGFDALRDDIQAWRAKVTA